MKIKKIVLIGKYRNNDITAFLQKVANYIVGLSFELHVDKDTIESMGVQYTVADESQSYDLAIVVGGDGSMMGAARTWGIKGVPLLGVNFGRVGFLTDVDKDNVFEKLGEILSGEFKTETRHVLQVNVASNGKNIIDQQIAINDLVIGRGVSGKLMEFSVFLDDEFVYSQYSDGLIIATPTGSTAYSVAAGGSIIHPNSSVLNIVPICPQNLSNRPLVVSMNSTIKVFFSGKDSIYWAIDGVEPEPVKMGNYFEITKSTKSIKLVHPKNYSYFNGLRTKLGWC